MSRVPPHLEVFASRCPTVAKYATFRASTMLHTWLVVYTKSTLHHHRVLSSFIRQFTFKRCKRNVNPFDKSPKSRIFNRSQIILIPFDCKRDSLSKIIIRIVTEQFSRLAYIRIGMLDISGSVRSEIGLSLNLQCFT